MTIDVITIFPASSRRRYRKAWWLGPAKRAWST